MGNYVVKFVSEAHTLQEGTKFNGHIILAGKIVVKAQYLRYMQEKNNWYWDLKNQKQVIISPTRTIVHPCLDVVTLKYVYDIHKSI